MGNAVAVGLYRDENGNVVVNYGQTQLPIPKWRYEENKYYRPSFAELPTKAQYEAGKAG